MKASPPGRATPRPGSPVFLLLLLLLLLICALLSVGPVAVTAQERLPDAPEEGRIQVFLDRPEPFQPLFGPVTMEATVVPPGAAGRVVFYVDSTVVGEVTEPPYRLTANVGQENREHAFEVIAYDRRPGRRGETASARVVTPALRVDEEVSLTLQQLYVTVTRGGADPGRGRAGRGSEERILDLTREDFRVEDEGRPQDLVTFARGDIPFTAVVLVDASVSMQGPKLRSAVAGARAFFRGMRALDEGKLLVFSDRLVRSTPFSTLPEVLELGLENLEAGGGTAVADHLYLALQQIEERQGRRVVVLLTDGADAHSVLGMGRVLRAARRSQALVYWLRLPYREGADGDRLPELRSAWRSSEDYRREYDTLERVVEESGGRVVPIAGAADIAPAFGTILRELREQYVLGYYPSDARGDGSWRRVTVEVQRPGLEVRCRGGYVDLE